MPYYVYIMSNRWNTVLYVGFTNDLARRAWQHRTGFYKHAFTRTYNCDKLVWYEEHATRQAARARERQIKEWKRAWKERLIDELNPTRQDIAPPYEP
ncbi:MAG TPA: GIY-YIG nuclease family protein [Flavobacteriales bacterium]|jgi:putative endonuclease|nr:GIY-YIG nuclease family protein [Flavobacteriales bacterium]